MVYTTNHESYYREPQVTEPDKRSSRESLPPPLSLYFLDITSTITFDIAIHQVNELPAKLSDVGLCRSNACLEGSGRLCSRYHELTTANLWILWLWR